MAVLITRAGQNYLAPLHQATEILKKKLQYLAVTWTVINFTKNVGFDIITQWVAVGRHLIHHRFIGSRV
jgi:hypothetical protein